MSRRLTAVTTTTIIDHHLFQLVDTEYPGERLAAPHTAGGWVTVGRASVLLESPYDSLDAILRLEEWDAEPGPEPSDDRGPWDDVVTVTIQCPNGAIAINQITAGYADSGFRLIRPGPYHVRLACRYGSAADEGCADALAGDDDIEGLAGVNAADGIDVKEEYLVRFWPATAG
jgi:hypothetical protein